MVRGGFRLPQQGRMPSSQYGLAGSAKLHSIRASGIDSKTIEKRFVYYLFYSVNYSSFVIFFATPPGGMPDLKNSFTLYGANRREPYSTVLSFSAFRPNSRHSMNRATNWTRQSPMPSPIFNPSSLLLLGLAHPVRNDKNTNQLLDSYPPALRQIFQLQEYSTIENLHEFHRLFAVTHS